MSTAAAPHVQLLSVPDCPLVDRVRAALHRELGRAGITTAVEELVGPYPSPTVLVDGCDVVTGKPPTPGACCRLDTPADGQIAAALERNRNPASGFDRDQRLSNYRSGNGPHEVVGSSSARPGWTAKY